MAVYLTLQRPDDQSFDGRRMLRVSAYILNHGHLGHGTFPASDGSSFYGIGFSLLALPTLALQRALADPSGLTLVTLANMLLLAVTAGIVVRIPLALGHRLTPAVLAGLAFGLLTMAVTYSSTMLSEPGVTFGTSLAVLGLVRWRQGTNKGALLAGIGVGCAVLFRTDSVLLLGLPTVIAAAVIVPKPALLRRAALALFLLPVFAAIGWTLWYNNYRTGNPFNTGYPDNLGFTFPWLHGLYRLLLSPGKGFFWYNPILFASLAGLAVLWRRDRAITWLITSLCLLRVAFYAKWWAPDGSVAFGPRTILPLCALLAVPLSAFFDHIARLRPGLRAVARATLAVLTACAFFVVALSVWIGQGAYWRAIHRYPPGLSEAARTSLLQSRIHASNDSWTASPLAYAARNIDHAKPFYLHWWNGGPSVPGMLFAGLALLLAVATIWTAVQSAGPQSSAAAELDGIENEMATRQITGVHSGV